MARMKNRPMHHRAWALGAAAVLASFAVAFLTLVSASPADAAPSSLGASGLRYTLLPVTALRPVSAAFSASPPKALVTAIATGVHGPYSPVADECSTCHRTHTSKNTLPTLSPQSNLCFSCHDGLGATANVRAQYTDPLVPANDPTNRLIYRHDATATTSHKSASLNEFGGASNRHSECTDCHNPHSANGANGTPTATGATASGRLAGVSGVAVANGAAGTAPNYAFLDGKTPATSITREYQLCFKCHSGFTTLDSNTGFPASRYRLDKAVEFNPNNPSAHPVEAPGKNTTPKMALSLSGPSPYKQWNFTTASTIRCSNCHASSTKYNLATPPSANGDLPTHTSKNPGILLQNYRNRVLTTRTAAYDGANFALCYMCHTDTPFKNNDSTATNFSDHNKHVVGIAGSGSSTSTAIDTPGAGSGGAICAECHFRQHSTTFKAGTQTIPGSKLVSFAPNVTASSGKIEWTSTGIGRGSCTLTCHGKNHGGESYGP